MLYLSITSGCTVIGKLLSSFSNRSVCPWQGLPYCRASVVLLPHLFRLALRIACTSVSRYAFRMHLLRSTFVAACCVVFSLQRSGWYRVSRYHRVTKGANNLSALLPFAAPCRLFNGRVAIVVRDFIEHQPAPIPVDGRKEGRKFLRFLNFSAFGSSFWLFFSILRPSF